MFAPLPFRLTRPTIAGPGENLGARRYELGRDEDRGQLRPRRTDAPWRGARGAKRRAGRRRLPDRAAGGAVPRLRRQRPGAPSRPVERALPRRDRTGRVPRAVRDVRAPRRGGERQLRQWAYFHCPSETHHVLVGAGDEPSVILMI